VNHYRRFVTKLARLVRSAARYSTGGIRSRLQSRKHPNAPTALIFSPHPDDECIVGGLALRLSREAKWNILNIAVTLGSNRSRRKARLYELKGACNYLGFGLSVAGGLGLEDIHPATRRSDPRSWARSVKTIADILKRNRPKVILLPCRRDGHRTHVGTHYLVLDVLRRMPSRFECFVVETESWGQVSTPNLLVELCEEDLAHLLTALSFHVGEVKRNPYHLHLPARMIDAVRRAETIGGMGTPAPDFMFATIYRLRRWKEGRLVSVLKHGKFLSTTENPASLFA
jgi:LmbE family N-acetylglucosaminyl deacetylase